MTLPPLRGGRGGLVEVLDAVVCREEFASRGPVHGAIYQLPYNLDDFVDVTDQLARGVTFPTKDIN